MARFTVEDDDDDTPNPTTHKRPRRSEPPPSQSHTSHEEDEDEEDDEDEELIPAEDVESDGESDGEEEDDEENESEDEDDEEDEEHGEYVCEDDDDEILSTAMTPGEKILKSIPILKRSVDLSPSVVVSNGNDEMQVVLTDPDVLDCPICLDPLRTPVFQCENGHIACSSCCNMVDRKCPSCCMPIGYNRCRAIEKVIESVKVPCKNARYGCTMRIMYNKKNEHEQMCPHGLCFCPYPSCLVSGSSKNLYPHFNDHHRASITRFTYDTTFIVRVPRNKKQTFLQERTEGVIFILNREEKKEGPAFNIDCVGPGSLKNSFGYQLTARNSKTTLSLICVPEVYAKWSEHTLKMNYLPVITDLYRHNGVAFIDVCIKKALSPV